MKNTDVYFLIGDCLREANVREETMPFSHRIADVRAERCYSPGTWTLSSHASLYALEDPIGHGQTQLDGELQPSQARLPRSAQENGYETSLFSENPTFGAYRGFDSHIDYCNSEINYKLLPEQFSPTEVVEDPSIRAVPKVFLEWLKRPRRLRNGVNLVYGFKQHFSGPNPHTYSHHGERVIQHLVSYLESSCGSVDGRLSFVNILDPHNPHWTQPPEPGAEPLGLEVSREETEALTEVSSREVMLTERDPPEGVTDVFPTWPDVYQRQEEIFEGQIRHTDHLIETFESEVPQQFAEALVVITGDHGHLFYEEETVEHHSSLHPGGVHVPLFISLPRSWEAVDREIEEPISLVDVARAVEKVVTEQVRSTDEFLAELTAGEGVVIAADGPMWDVSELRAQYDDSLVDELAARRVAVVDGEVVTEYESPWRFDEITETKYVYSEDDRSIIEGPTARQSLDSDRIEEWLRRDSGDEAVAAAATDRLKQLGYVQ